MRISDWSSDVCSSDLDRRALGQRIEIEVAKAFAARRLGAGAVAGRRRRRRGPITASVGRPLLLLHLTGDEQGIGILDRKSVVKGQSVSVRVALGGRLIITKEIENKQITNEENS